MILDNIKNIQLYADLSPSIVRALKYLRDTDFSKLAPGRYEISGNEIFSIIHNYKTKEMEDCRLEAHRRYIDIHFMAEGSEVIGYSLFNNQEPATDYDEENDFILYCGEKNYLILDEGMFAVFYPSDLHMPGLITEKPTDVKKVVIKVKVSDINYSLV
jgi:YhcH/YjgK/YiaL family protein